MFLETLEKSAETIDSLIKKVVEHDDSQAFKDLFYLLVPKLCSYAMYLTGNKQVSEDIASDVMVKFWMRRNQIYIRAGTRSYFYIATRNLAFNFLRDQGKMRLVGLENAVYDQFVQFEDGESILLNDELKSIIERSILNLPERCRMVFQLIKDEKMSYKQVAELMDISIKTVENQICKALQKIREVIDAYRS